MFSSALMLCCRENLSYIYLHIFLCGFYFPPLPALLPSSPSPPLPSLQASLSLRSLNSLIRLLLHGVLVVVVLLLVGIPASLFTQTWLLDVSLTRHLLQDVSGYSLTPVTRLYRVQTFTYNIESALCLAAADAARPGEASELLVGERNPRLADLRRKVVPSCEVE
ncbi:hypothetical protein E2C01_086427 [Portunus trituberculatus]|uniref:Uncharacterized protein n=1 Tax=Portunus trituberculatus TaxID=210409 RepID=A0A5B7J5D2_PORTR|nr:hypothetical protein [Portunus trituberculatus]